MFLSGKVTADKTLNFTIIIFTKVNTQVALFKFNTIQKVTQSRYRVIISRI